LIAFLGSVFIYLEWFELPCRLIETISALMFFGLLLQASRAVWFWSGFFISAMWFWWIVLSFEHYAMVWAAPIGLLLVSLVYASVFWTIAYVSQRFHQPWTLAIRAIAILLLSYIHPLGFDWFKPELMLVHSYLGVAKWQLAIILISICVALYRKNALYLLIILLSYSPYQTTVSYSDTVEDIALSTTMITVEDKWNPKLVGSHIRIVFDMIDKAIVDKKSMIVLPESVFPFFLNKNQTIFDKLLTRSQSITIVIGALYLDGRTHRNSTYIIDKGRYQIANKVVLVPFGESNPLPGWASGWVNQIFFDGAIDYAASAMPTDFELDGVVYRNAICYEATSEQMYEDTPRQMIVTSNNGWFTPSTEPTLQRLLLELYSRKYGTTIYHSINMSPSYMVQRVER